MAKSELAPHPAHTIPRLELCAAVLATELSDFILEKMDVDVHLVRFYTDSKIVLGYIYNTTCRFYVYVSNRVIRIRSSDPSQWCYVSTKEYPADHGTRPTAAGTLKSTNWFTGPAFLTKAQQDLGVQPDVFELVHPEVEGCG